jgi:hypothetical protein
VTASAVEAGTVPVAVSPGDPSKLVLIADICPTFSWGSVDGATAYDLVVYRLGTEPEGAEPVLQRRISGSASSWTPSLDRCLEAGYSYAWTLRAEGEKVASEWAAPSLFRITPLATVAEMRRTLELLQRQLTAVEPEIDRVNQSEPAGAQIAPPARRLDAATVGPELLLGAAAGIHAEPPGEELAVGVRSVIQGDGAAGVFVSAGEGAILSGLSGDRLAFEVGARGDIFSRGEVAAASFSGSGADLTDVTASDVACVGCVGTGDLEDGSVDSTDIADGSITWRHLGVGQVESAHVHDGGLYGVDIAHATLLGAHLVDGTVTTIDVQDGSLSRADLGDLTASIAGNDLKKIWSVTVECSGGCGDSTLAQICAFAAPGLRPVSVACTEVPSYSGITFYCHGATDNTCVSRELAGNRPLSDFCDDQNGWDANVYCMEN